MLTRLQDAPDYQLAEGEPDVRGWKVFDSDCKSLGAIDTLILDTDANEIRYLSVTGNGRKRMVPVGLVDIDEMDKQILLKPNTRFDTLPTDTGEPLTAEREKQVYSTFIPEAETREKAYQRPEFKHESDHLTLIEERLRVGKRQEKIGEAVARKRIQQHPVEEQIELRREHVEVERRPINKPLSQTEFASTRGQAFQEGQEIHMPLMEEEAVVSKEPFVKEEIILRKTTDSRRETIRETLREEVVEFTGTEPEGRMASETRDMLEGTDVTRKQKKPGLGERIKRDLGMD
ncbi:Stress response protein YsnF [compost metagenome]